MRKNFSEEKKSIEEKARFFYSAQLEYHNFEHALAVWKLAQEIIERCRVEGKNVNREVIYYACLFHDAGYHEQEKEKGFESKEQYAAAIAQSELQGIGVDQGIIEQVRVAILATEGRQDVGNMPIEAMIVRAADLAGFAQSYETFLENNRKLKLEVERIKRSYISDVDWKEKTKEITKHYLSQKIQLTQGYEDESGESVFHKKTKENLARFLSE